MDVHAAQHLSQSEFTVRAESASRVPLLRVPKRPEQHVPEGKIGIVERVHAFLMVDAVALRPLESESQPVRRGDIPVIDEFCETAEHHRCRGRSGLDSHSGIQNEAADETVEQDFKRVLVETGNDLDPLRAVMNLMHPAPEKWRFVTPAMPPVKYKRNRKITEDGAARSAQSAGRPQAMPHQPAVPHRAGKPDRENLKAIEEQRAQPPTAHLRPMPPRTRVFVRDHADACDKYSGEDEHGAFLRLRP